MAHGKKKKTNLNADFIMQGLKILIYLMLKIYLYLD